MELKFDVVKGQKFEAGRVINFAKCDCEKCTYLNCPKKNYAVKTKPHKYSVKEFLAEYGERLKGRSRFPRDLLEEFIGECFAFPKGIYWDLNLDATCVEFKSFSRSGNECLKAYIEVDTGRVVDYDLNNKQYDFIQRVSKGLQEVAQYQKEG